MRSRNQTDARSKHHIIANRNRCNIQKNTVHNRALNQEINQLNLLDTEKIVALEKELFGQTGDELFVNPHSFKFAHFHLTLLRFYYSTSQAKASQAFNLI